MLLFSILFTLVVTISIVLIHSLAIGVYWPLLAHMYKKECLLTPLAPPRRVGKEDELSGVWREGWLPLGATVLFVIWG